MEKPVFPISTTTTVPWTPRDIAWGSLLWMAFFLSFGLATELLPLSIDISLVIIGGELMLLLPTWYFTIYKYGATWSDLGLRAFKPHLLLTGCGLMMLFFLVSLIYASLLALFDLQAQPGLNQIFEKTAFPMALFFGGAIVAPFVEEVFFRGFIFLGLRDRWGWRYAMAGSAALFALAHVIPTSLLPIFLLGLIFAFLAQLTNSIWPAIIIHMCNNMLALTLVYSSSL